MSVERLMKFLIYCITFIISLSLPSQLLSQGLKFKGSECPIDERTSFDVFHKKTFRFKETLNIRFNVSIQEPTHIGYIIRIKNPETNTTYNLSSDNQSEYIVFKFNEEGRTTLITASIKKESLLSRQWFGISISFDSGNDLLSLNINDNKYDVKNIKLPDTWAPSIYFGKSDYIIDVPSFAIKDLVIADKEQSIVFPLKEDTGTNVHSSDSKIIGEVSNPVWLINDAYYWRYKVSFKSRTVAGSNFNPQREEIYFFNSDSLSVYNVRTGNIAFRKYQNPCPMPLVLGTSFVDYVNNRLYAYEVYTNNEKRTSVVSLDLSDNKWQQVCSETLPMQLHHHGAYLDTEHSVYTIFGGFGNMHYSKSFYTYDINQNHWDSLAFSGDKIYPRYFQSMGYMKQSNSLYIFGGMGNESGDQIVGRRYFYDLYKVDLNNKTIKKLWEIKWDKDNIVPIRGMVLADDSSFYTLCYPEHFSNSHLKLYRFSLKDGSYQILGDSIPIHSEKIKTNANLYFNSKLNELYAIVQEFENDDTASDVKIYSLAFPPVTKDELSVFTQAASDSYLWIALPFLFVLSALCIIFYIVFKRRHYHKADTKVEKQDSEKTDVEISFGGITRRKESPNSIYLFGEFSVRDRHNREISYMFSAKLKQVFLIILEHSLDGNGITSQYLSSLLWPDRPEDKVKNSRGVTINHLRKILDELDGIKLIHEKGSYKIVCSAPCYCDCFRCIDIISADTLKDNRQEFAEILIRGKFLESSNDELFDTLKERIEQKLEPVLLIGLETEFVSESYYVTAVFAEALFNIDPLNEEALYYMINALMRSNQQENAKKKYLSFASDYKKLMGKEYSRSFSDLIAEK